MTLAKINGFSSITSVGICVFLTVYLALKNALLLLWFLNFGIADSGLCVCLKTTKTPAIIATIVDGRLNIRAITNKIWRVTNE